LRLKSSQTLDDEEAWARSFRERSDRMRSLAREALEEHRRGEIRPLERNDWMNSFTSRRFRELFSRLPTLVQSQARRAYRLFRENPAHPNLNFKKVDEKENIYSAGIGLGYRAPGQTDGSDIVWFWIGSHDEYEKLI